MQSILGLGVVVNALWVSVTPQTINEPVPEYYYSADSMGSVQDKPYRNSKVVNNLCPVYENGRLVGYSLLRNCE